jgi:hypothetical protein
MQWSGNRPKMFKKQPLLPRRQAGYLGVNTSSRDCRKENAQKVLVMCRFNANGPPD